jgi:phosphoglycerate dehydrogenase-like enzyme
LSDAVEVLVITATSAQDLERIAEVDSRVQVVDAGDWFNDEIRETWPAWAVRRYMGQRPASTATREARDGALATAEVILGGWPLPLDLRSRATRLRWFHRRPAGASNLFQSDLWGSDVTVTTSRGFGNTRAMAEYVLACFLHFARGLHRAESDRGRQDFDHRSYRPVTLAGKTVCVVGTGGIGNAVAELCAAAGMRVVGTRRHQSDGVSPAPPYSKLLSAVGLNELLAESSFVAVCCPWTRETTNLIGREAFEAMRDDSVVVNVARGEIVDEAALLDALDVAKLRGVALDVYTGEFERAPESRLWQHDRVLITPHVSGGSDTQQHRGIELFCDNLRRYLSGSPMANVVDWERGY